MFISPSELTTSFDRVRATRLSLDTGERQSYLTDVGPFAIADFLGAQTLVRSTGGALDSSTLSRAGEFALVMVGAQSAVFAFRSGATVYGVSSNTSRAV